MLPILFIRYNPDVWKVNEVTQRTQKHEKANTLVSYILPFYEEQAHLDDDLQVTHMYYPTRSGEVDDNAGSSSSPSPIYEFSQEELQSKLQLFQI